MQQKIENSLIVKVSLKKAVYNLGKNIKTHADILAQIKNRFPELPNFSITFKETPVTAENFESILMSQLNQGQTSIKFQLNELPTSKLVPSKSPKSKKFSFDPTDFEDEKDLPKKFEEPKKSTEFQELKFQENQPSKSQVNDIDLSLIKIKVLMGDTLSTLKKEIGEEYKWSCNFINQASTDVPEGVFIRQIATNKLTSLAGMGAKEAEQIEFGPYVEKQFGKFTKFYQIVYQKEKSAMIPIGNKFGFTVEASKKLDVKELSSKLYKKVSELKNFSATEKSTEYIMAKFKELGLDDSTIHRYGNDDLIDMMESFNINQ